MTARLPGTPCPPPGQTTARLPGTNQEKNHYMNHYMNRK